MAKMYMSIAKQSPRHYMISAEPWSLWLHEKKIMSDLETTLYDIVHAKEAKAYWMKKDQLPLMTIEQINWEVIDVAMKETKRSSRVFLSKHVSRMCGVGKFIKRWKQRPDSSCPRCGEHEDAPHVWTCQGPGVEDI